jgi:hypothetical protein
MFYWSWVIDVAQALLVVDWCDDASRGGPIGGTTRLLWQLGQPRFKWCKEG